MIKELIPRNISRENLTHLDRVLTRPSSKQIELTNEYITPNIEAILSDLRILRTQADKAVKNSPDDKDNNYSSPYPVGRCLEITEHVYNSLIESLNNPSLHGVHFIRKFIKEGGLIKRVWVIQDEHFFQNAIQLGASILDVAMDTFDPKKDPVKISESAKFGGYETITSIEKLADAMEIYWGGRVYPNIYIPALGATFPLLHRKRLKYKDHPNKQIDIDGLFLSGGQEGVFNVNLAIPTENGDFFGLTEEFLFKSKYSGRRLPKESYEALLDSPLFKHLSKNTGGEVFISDDPERAREYLNATFYKSPENYHKINSRVQFASHINNLIGKKPIATFSSKAKDNEQE